MERETKECVREGLLITYFIDILDNIIKKIVIHIGTFLINI